MEQEYTMINANPWWLRVNVTAEYRDAYLMRGMVAVRRSLDREDYLIYRNGFALGVFVLSPTVK